MLDVTASHRRSPQVSITRPPHDRGTVADVMVTSAGRLRCAPVLFAATRRLDAGNFLARRHAGVVIVTVMLHGAVAQLDGNRQHVLGPDDVSVRRTGRGIEHRLLAEWPAALLELWLAERSDAPSGYLRYTKPRIERVEQWCTIAEAGGAIVRAIVLPVGTTTLHGSERRSYVVSTLGRILVDGHIAEPDARIAVRGSGNVCITALESTEVVAVTLR